MPIANLRQAVINEQIAADYVRLIGADGAQMGIVPLDEALRRAGEQGLDLVQMAADSDPIVCRLMDYGKHLFALKKSQAAARRKQHKQQVKEVKFRLGTDQADYQVKLRKLQGFLEGGDKAKVTIHLRGREMLRREQGLALLAGIADELREVAKIEQEAQGDERNLGIVLLPLRRGYGSADKKKAGVEDAAQEQSVASDAATSTAADQSADQVEEGDKKKAGAEDAAQGQSAASDAATSTAADQSADPVEEGDKHAQA